MQVFSPCEGDSTLKAKKVYAIKRRKLWSGDLNRVSSNSTPSRGTTRGSETGGLSLTGDTREDECQEKLLTDPIESEDEEEKTETSVQVSNFQLSVSGEQDLEPSQHEKSGLPKSVFGTQNTPKKDKQISFEVKMGDLIGEGINL